VRRGEVWTSTGDYCLGGITRGNIIRVAEAAGITVRQKNFSLTDVYGADEAFVTGTFAGLTPVREVDGRIMGHPLTGPSPIPGEMTLRLQDLYRDLIEQEIYRP
jgi:branched-chain amino acid aminotransferase